MRSGHRELVKSLILLGADPKLPALGGLILFEQAIARVNYTYPINFASRRSDVPMMRLILGKDPHKRERQIVFSLGEQRARVYDATGEKFFSAKVSSGKRVYRTRQGKFVITDKHLHHQAISSAGSNL